MTHMIFMSLSLTLLGYNILVWKPKGELAEKQSLLMSSCHGNDKGDNRGPQGRSNKKRPPKDKNAKDSKLKTETATKTKLKVIKKKP